MNRLNLIRNHLAQSEDLSKYVVVEESSGNPKIKIVRLSNTKNLNALSPEFGEAIYNALEKLDSDDNTKVKK